MHVCEARPSGGLIRPNRDNNATDLAGVISCVILNVDVVHVELG